jgi:corrinoid protein of di/trimethylamine methyltransferase
MTASKEALCKSISDHVFHMEEEAVSAVCREYVQAGYPALQAIMDGLVDGMSRANALFEKEEYYIAELLLCSDAMYAGLTVLRPHLKESGTAAKKTRVVIGVVEGDIHDIGKNLVRIMLEVSGFEVFDLGANVPLPQFVKKAKETDAKVICLSTLLTTTMDRMAAVIELLKEAGIRDAVKVLVGGAPVSQKFADLIGADGYAENAAQAAGLAKELAESL